MELPQQKLFNIYSRGKLWKQFGILTVFLEQPDKFTHIIFSKGKRQPHYL